MENFSLTPSHIIEYLFCPRFIYFEYVLRIPEFQDKYFKVQKGRELHARKEKENIEYLRKRIGVVEKYIGQYLTNDVLRGEVDEVLLLDDGTMAPLDYKFAEFKDRIFETYQTQLYCYAWLIEDNFGISVNRGYLVYTRSQNKLVEVPISRDDIDTMKKCAVDIQDLITKNWFPKATRYKRRCLDCTYRNICIQ